MKLLAAALAVVMGAAVAHAAQAPETLMMTGPNFQQVPSSKMIVTPNGGSPTTLGAALSNIVPSTGGTFTGGINAPSISMTSAIQNGAYGMHIMRSGACNSSSAGPNCSAININDTITALSNPEYHNYFFSDLNLGGSLAWTWQNLYSIVQIEPTTTTNAEVNASHFLINNNGTMAAQSEAAEIAVQNGGTISGTAYGGLSFLINTNTGTVTGGVVGYQAHYQNDNTTAGSVSSWVGFECDPKAGVGSVAASARCFFNSDPAQEISTEGHLSFRGSTLPTVSGCTGCSVDTNTSDMMGTITEGTSTTGATITFAQTYMINGNCRNPHIIIVPISTGALQPVISAASCTAFTFSHAAGTAFQYTWFVGGAL